ncbi:MAG: WYL domain-containing protein [Clostridia bacterium]|nr:WYL domain-containing protein [Clostridia bacterium]
MVQNGDHKIKLLLLWDILCRYTDEEHPMNTDEIIEKLAEKGIADSRKVLAADIALLNEYGYEVLSFKKKYHYYYVANRPFDTAEIVLLSDVIKASKLSPAQKKQLIDKLSGTLGLYQAEIISNNIVSFGRSRGNSSIIYSVDSIERAINENKQVSFLYFDYDEDHKKAYRKDGERYLANPIIMVWDRDNYYLLCFNNRHDNIVTYRLDKMEDVKVEATERQPHPEYELFNTEEYRKQVVSMFGGELQRVTLTFTHDILSDMFDKFGSDIRIHKKTDDTYSVTVNVQVSKPLFVWIIGTQGKVRIKSPCNVLEQFNAFVEKIKETY